MTLVTKNLGVVKGLHISTSAPVNTDIIWFDDNAGQKIHKYYNTTTSSWTPFGAEITLTGDVTGTGIGSLAVTIANDAVTFSKMQNVDENTFVGRNDSGSGNLESLTISEAQTLIGLSDISSFRKAGITGLEVWYSSSLISSQANTALTLARDTIVFVPFTVSKSITLDRIALNVTGAGDASSVGRCGIYNSSNILPTTLIVDSGSFLVNDTGIKSTVIDITLVAGQLYWLCFNHNSSSSVNIRAFASSATGFPNVLGMASASSSTL